MRSLSIKAGVIIAAILAVGLSIACGICAAAIKTPPQAECCTPRLQTVKADGTTWICLIEEDTAGVERHRSCQMSDMSEHIEK